MLFYSAHIASTAKSTQSFFFFSPFSFYTLMTKELPCGVPAKALPG
jgi:hypothetical protein